MKRFLTLTVSAIVVLPCLMFAGEKTVASLKDFRKQELKYAGIEVPRGMKVHLVGVGGGGEKRWTYHSNRLFAYGWIINADTREQIWSMTTDNTKADGDDRVLDENLTLQPGSYEIYFAAATFSYHTALSHFTMNADHRNDPLFGPKKGKEDFWSSLMGWWTEDMGDEWERRAQNWGIDLLVDAGDASAVRTFTPPKSFPHVLLQKIGVGESELDRIGFTVAKPVSLEVYALGEAPDRKRIVDYSQIVNTLTRERVWEMSFDNTENAGGGKKNILFRGPVQLSAGSYVLYYRTDDSHSSVDWNDGPPSDPLNYGVTIMADKNGDTGNFKLVPYDEKENLILSITKVGDSEQKNEGFALKQDARVRVYALGERGNSRRQLADYGYITEARTRKKIWQMDADRVLYAGGASKNCYVDDVIFLSKGSYIVTYITDDSHSYNDWNADPPFDPESYGISIMGVGDSFNKSIVSQYVEERDKTIIAQIVRVRDNSNKQERFSLSRPTRMRVYSLGEGFKHEMADYGWIEDASTGSVKWEMTYAMTTFAGGNRKNRLVNTTIVLDRGNYVLHYKTDDSHSYMDWNVDPPDDAEYWGITLYNDEVPGSPAPPPPP